MYCKITENVLVQVDPIFLKEGSKPEDHIYLWAYHVRIENQREGAISLKRRHWCIADSKGYVQQVRGLGVVGEQPCILPGAFYEYASGAILATPSGMMMGSYMMELENQERLLVHIPPFSLDSPYEKLLPN